MPNYAISLTQVQEHQLAVTEVGTPDPVTKEAPESEEVSGLIHVLCILISEEHPLFRHSPKMLFRQPRSTSLPQ